LMLSLNGCDRCQMIEDRRRTQAALQYLDKRSEAQRDSGRRASSCYAQRLWSQANSGLMLPSSENLQIFSRAFQH
jgi:hypothetical protein